MDIASGNANQSRDQFLQLLVTQIRHQDPLAPMEQDQMLAQLAQFSTLEGIENLNSGFERFLEVQERQNRTQDINRAADLIGREVVYDGGAPTAADASDDVDVSRTGTIDSVLLRNNQIQLQVNQDSILLDDVRQINRGITAE